jgi:hypothetical protein
LKEPRVTRPLYGCCNVTHKHSEIIPEMLETDIVLTGSAMWSVGHCILHGKSGAETIILGHVSWDAESMPTYGKCIAGTILRYGNNNTLCHWRVSDGSSREPYLGNNGSTLWGNLQSLYLI